MFALALRVRPGRLALAALLALGPLWVPVRAFAEPLDPTAGRALAGAFVEALNARDEDALGALFDVQATVAADRMAWRAQDVRAWAHRQIAERIRVEPTRPYDVVGSRVKWTARVSRSDWQRRGVDALELWESIIVDHGRIIAFMSQPRDGGVAALLGEAWRPDAPPDPPQGETPELAWSADLPRGWAVLGLLTIVGLARGLAWANRRTCPLTIRADRAHRGGVLLAGLGTLAAAKRAQAAVREPAPGPLA